MKYIGENAIKKLISLIKGDLAKKQDSITVSGLLKGDGTTISAAVAETDYMAPPTGGTTGQVLKKTETGTEWADDLVPDWNQNDSTAADYVKNRPFYTGDPVETVLVEESTVAFTEKNGLYEANFSSTFEAIIGETYKVSWDGTVYECVCSSFQSMPVIGNLSIAGAGSDTGEPFIMGIMNGERIQILTADTSSSHTFSISRTDAPVVKIDKKYLIQPDWNQNDKTAADYVKNRPFYSETGNVTVENAIGDIVLERFPVFAVGDTVTVNVDGVEHSLVAYEDTGSVAIGDSSSSFESGKGQFGWTIYVVEEVVKFYAEEVHTVSYLGTDYHHKIDPKYLPASFKPDGKSYLTFSSLSSFTLAVADATKHWNGILEYFSSDRTWTVWDGTTTLSSVNNDGEYVLYLRGTGNSMITENGARYRWVLSGSDISCIGNIENLLDYATVASGEHPTMANSCYASMFRDCTSLTQAPALSATTLANYCYANMFQGCTNLTQAPNLPATTLANNCYENMFRECTSLTKAPALPATTMAVSCYSNMFNGCTNLTTAPALPATTMAFSCYSNMFYGCTNLTTAPALPATTMADNCYANMFNGCTSLTQVPNVLPATTLANSCYENMFRSCTSLTKAPALPATTLANYCYANMFQGCTNLTQAPNLPAITLADHCYYYMFNGCTSLKLSSVKTDEYTQEYRIPSSDIGTIANNALTSMFISTGGPFTGTPKINTTYYLSSDNMIVHETEITTLNDYVGSMIEGLATQEYVDGKVPNDGTTGQVLKKTETGTEWADAPQTITIPETTALLKGDGAGGVSAAVAGTDYITPDGMNYALAETKPFIVTFTYNGDYHADKTFEEIKAAYDAGKMCYANFLGNICLRGIFNNSYVMFIVSDAQGSSESITTGTGFVRIYSDNSIVFNSIQHQPVITASGLLKGDGNGGVSAAVAGTDYMAPVTGGTAGQVLTKTTDGQEWQDREKATFIVTLVSSTEVDKTVAEIKAANDAGRVCFLSDGIELYPLFAVNDTEAIFVQSNVGSDDKTIVHCKIKVNADGNVSIIFAYSQTPVEAAGLLKGHGDGDISSAVAGTDYIDPNGDGSNVTAAFTAASTRANVATGEKLSTLFGKIAKWLADLGSLAFKSTVAKSDLASDVQTELSKAGALIVTVTWDSTQRKYVADQTYANLRAALNAGKTCIAVYGSTRYICSTEPIATTSDLIFSSVITSSEYKTIYTLTIASTDVISLSAARLTYFPNGTTFPTTLLKGSTSSGLISSAIPGKDYIASGNIVKQTLVATETTPTEDYAINWVYG